MAVDGGEEGASDARTADEDAREGSLETIATLCRGARDAKAGESDRAVDALRRVLTLSKEALPRETLLDARFAACGKIGNGLRKRHAEARVRDAAATVKARWTEMIIAAQSETPVVVKEDSKETVASDGAANDPAACFEDAVLRLVVIEANMFRFTRSEAVAESLMNALTVVTHECTVNDQARWASTDGGGGALSGVALPAAGRRGAAEDGAAAGWRDGGADQAGRGERHPAVCVARVRRTSDPRRGVNQPMTHLFILLRPVGRPPCFATRS